MKKILIVMMALWGFNSAYGQTTTTTTTTTTPAQETTSNADSDTDFKRGYIGVRGLMTFTSLKVKGVGNGAVETSYKAGYGGGGVLGVNLTRNFGLQLEVLYSSLSQTYKDESGFEREFNVNYINVPLLLMLNTDVSKGLNLNLAVGPQLGLNTGSSLDKMPQGAGVNSVNAVLAVKSGDIGFAYGAGLDFMIGDAVKLSLGFRGVRGLVDISDDSQNITTDEYYVLDRAKVNTYSGYAGVALCF